MILADLQSRLRIALTNTLVEEWTLFTPTTGTSRPSARTIAFHLGWYLRQTVERTWSVDSEYDRSGMVLEQAVQFDGDTRHVPDLIVHQRGLLGPEHNLLLAHVSVDEASGPDDVPELSSAQALQRRFGYRYAMLLDLRLHVEGRRASVTPYWQWATLEKGAESPEPVAVYTPRVLAEITERARRAGD
ncbi:MULTISPECIES: hypothetical protein [Cellulomonas]|uniref:Uncharacterized protein n=1 Tax=Cellulomonas gilvus (strain ATCC 13127 / NRRL B-14078) TaxID=593907 RepID=F8A1M5_CELGA|nr:MULTISPECIES: hypothetical protein [Cellulomonas]AEI10546.1 hypothetical protein Celgi_0012 [Cellulomonas gilvus ATCC 13127]MCR6688538.1 hypothetical protein [Cellulomonas sp.]